RREGQTTTSWRQREGKAAALKRNGGRMRREAGDLVGTEMSVEGGEEKKNNDRFGSR
ncbi:hypothetical protein A2U01_0109135, partial [Trifolium medium]|nr:hypothetical protein [Trifolium medium]